MNSPAALAGIRLCVFDAYGTLFDTGSVARLLQDRLGANWQALSDLWRAKQLQYTWLRGLAGRHADFWQVTGEALDFSLESFAIRDQGLRDRLMGAYLTLEAYPEVPHTLTELKRRGLRLAILSNGTPAMLEAVVNHAGIAPLLDAVLSVESVGVYKPHPHVYGMVGTRFGTRPHEVCFLSSNGWDAFSAQAFGFRTLWCNRSRQPRERIPDLPEGELADLSELPVRLG